MALSERYLMRTPATIEPMGGTPMPLQAPTKWRYFLSVTFRKGALLCALAFAPGLTTAAHAQPALKVPTTFRTLALGAQVTNIFYDNRGKPVPISAGSSGFSSTYPAPENGHLAFYRMLPSTKPGEPPRRIPVGDVRLGQGGPFLIFMMMDPASPTEIKTLAIDDSWENHPVGTMHLFSFSRRPVTVKVGEDMAELTTAKSHLFSYPETGNLWVQAATQDAGKWKLRLSGPELTLPNARSTVVLLDEEPTEGRPNPDGLTLRNLIDPAPSELSP